MLWNQAIARLVVAGLTAGGAALEASVGADDGPGVIATMDEVRFRPPAQKGTLEPIDGKVGGAVRFRFEADAPSTFCTSTLRGTPEWDRAAGFSFWVRGAGGSGYGGLQFLYDDDYAVRYDLCFPVIDGQWTRVVVRWGDLIPVLPGPRALPLGTPDGNRPGKLSALWIGRWWYWGSYPALAFDLDDIRLEPTIERDEPAHRPDGPPLGRVLAKLRAGQPVTIVTLGDSLTDKRHWANRERAWVDELRDRLQTTYGARATIVNPAIGGTQLRQNLVLMPRWLAEAPEPDLVTVCFGGNDREAGMRGPEFERACAEAIDRIRLATRGQADVLLMTTTPAAARWEATEELAEACRRAARARQAGLADTAAAFRTQGGDQPDRLFVNDRVHLSRAGHDLVAEVVLQAIAAGGAGAPAPADPAVTALPRIRVSQDRTHFVRDGSAARFLLWGFNYDHDDRGRLLEDYWEREWETVVADFGEMKAMGANVVRVHLQLGRFLTDATTPDRDQLDRLARLVRLAEQTGVYLDLTGLGGYHKADVPAWYDALGESERWAAQATFWRAIAGVGQGHAAVFCYDLMNEPILTGGNDKDQWLPGPPLDGKSFVQRITRDARGRSDAAIAGDWVRTLTQAIRAVDRDTLITVGEIPWSQPFPTYRPLFHAPEVGGPLDFVSVHFYPRKDQLDADLAALRAYEVGKPIVVEEFFPLNAGFEGTEAFLDRSRPLVDGWISFYWGKTVAELEQTRTLRDAITAGWLRRFQALAPTGTAPAP